MKLESFKKAALGFILSFVLSQIVVLFLVFVLMFFGMESDFIFSNPYTYSFISVFNQLSFAFIFLYFYNNGYFYKKLFKNKKNIIENIEYNNYKSPTIKDKSIFKKINISYSILFIIFGLSMLFALTPIVSMVEVFFNKINISTNSTLSYSINTWPLFLISLFTMAVLPAVCEELLFRGLIQSELNKATSPLFSIFFTAIFFAIFHLSATQFIYPLLLGIFLSTVMYSTKSIWYTIIIHFINNSVVLINMFLTNSDTSTSTPVFSLSLIILSILGIIYFTAVILFIINKKNRILNNTFLSRKKSINSIPDEVEINSSENTESSSHPCINQSVVSLKTKITKTEKECLWISVLCIITMNILWVLSNIV